MGPSTASHAHARRVVCRPTIYADGKNVYVLMGTTLHYWNAFLPLDVSTVNITVTDCNIAGSKDQATSLKKAAVRGGVFMFTAYKPYVTYCILKLGPLRRWAMAHWRAPALTLPCGAVIRWQVWSQVHTAVHYRPDHWRHWTADADVADVPARV